MRLLFWNDTPPTHTYTYVHPLSLHDALPCCPAAPRRCTSDARSRRAATPKSPRAAGGRYRHISPRGKPGCGPAAWYRNRDSRNADSFENGGGFGKRRSEEHTSELQSLMRISYAVFCLKKKKNTK